MINITEVRCNNKINPIGVGHPIFSWKVNMGKKQQNYRIVVKEGEVTVWDSGIVLSSQTCGIEYEGLPLKGRAEYRYKVYLTVDGQTVESEEQFFETALLEGFSGKWIHYPNNYPGYAMFARNIKHLKDKPVKARMYICGIGYYETVINGQKVGKSLLNPGVTAYSKHVLYDTYDVTAYYRQGDNMTGVLLGDGWYGGQKFICEIYFEFADGSFDFVNTGSQMDWFFTGSPITRQSIFGGETYDARREALVDGWNGEFRHINYFESGWMFTLYADPPAGALVPQENEPIEVTEIIPVKEIKKLKEGVYLYDMGVIFAGVAKIRVKGERGTKITLKHAEGITPEGYADQLNLRSAQATDTYILKGEGVEEYAPRFTYHGFRYIQVEIEGEAEIEHLEGLFIHSAVKQIGEFECSDPIINKLHENVLRTERSNIHSIPTDCPQRDERLGWLNDLTSRLDQALNNFDVLLFYRKFMQDITDTQDERGCIGDTAPYKTGSRPADPVVVSYLLIPLRLYQRYGDLRLIKEHYGPCKKWVDYLISIAEGELLHFGIYGDWAPPKAYAIPNTPCNSLTEPYLVSSAYLNWYCRILQKFAGLLGKAEDETYYKEKAERVKEAYNRAYFDPTLGRYKNKAQAGNAIPLNLGLCPVGYEDSVAAFISADVAEHDDHLTTGNQAYKHMLESLGDRGYAEQMVRMITNPTYPGWGYMIASGATSIWERWESEMANEMNSFCHPMHGSIDSWFYSCLGGIRFAEDSVGGDKPIIRPAIGGLDYVRASIEGARGKLAVSWERQERKVTFAVTIPPLTDALFIAPGEICSVNSIPASGRELPLSAGEYTIEVIIGG